MDWLTVRLVWLVELFLINQTRMKTGQFERLTDRFSRLTDPLGWLTGGFIHYEVSWLVLQVSMTYSIF
jgi:hypothetical protein